MKKRWFTYGALFLIFSIILSIGDSLCFKANVGVVPYEAMALTLSYFTGIEVGTLSFCVNTIMIILQVILRKKIDVGLLLQIPLIIVISTTINWMVYTFLAWMPSAYLVRLLLTLVGFAISALGVGLLVALNLVVMPSEGFAAACADRLKKDFTKVRHTLDVIFLLICVMLSLTLKVPFAVREGTIIATIIYVPIMGVVVKYAKPRIDRLIGR